MENKNDLFFKGLDRIFLHICCGPCAEWPVEFLYSKNIDIQAYFYNPNIHPEIENKRRSKNAQKLMEIKNIPLIIDEDYLEEKWKTGTWEDEKSRCRMCYQIRMMKAAQAAKENGFTSFTTSLLVSPYQNFDAIVEAGFVAGRKEDIQFLPFDFRDGYRKGQEMAKNDGLYRQKYCGCIFSLESSFFKEKILAEHEKLIL